MTGKVDPAVRTAVKEYMRALNCCGMQHGAGSAAREMEHRTTRKKNLTSMLNDVLTERTI
ncbi:hypothetical protein DPMN_122034 [Dreissena polymorpha]|uniref:Uncharacterized protein n=1 Tax=Dreissena polymorpha TaxID=45954 RepID=A0A9D4GR63_DREPO|nr:hypothetical protein DPMN_122034 [Dreissena polymorpha]